jgi:hypothetical protein
VWRRTLSTDRICVRIRRRSTPHGAVVSGGPDGVGHNSTCVPGSRAHPDSAVRTLTAFSFIDDEHGWIALGGRIESTDDAGRTWRSSGNTQTDTHALKFESPTDGWALADSRLLRTSNGGAQWFTVPGVQGPFLGMEFVNASTGWIWHGAYGTVALSYTQDGGTSWVMSPIRLERGMLVH